MAELVAGPAIDVVKWVGKQIIRQLSYLYYFTININSLKDEAEKLDNATEGLQGQVDREKDNGRVILPEVEDWLTKSNDIKNQKNKILDKVEDVESRCLKLGARFSLSKTATKTTDRMRELLGQKKFDATSKAGPPVATQVVPLGNIYKFKSRKEIEEDIMTTLKGEGVSIIGICGMGGLGKTTMAKTIKNRVLEENIFQEAVMAVVSRQVDNSKILDEIAGQLDLNLEETSNAARVQKLHARLSGTKRILLVLDDVWQRLVLTDLGIPCNSKGCTILLTSRNRDVLRAMKVKIFGMKLLSEEDAWILFREGAGTCVDDAELNSIAKQVVKKCRGLPIALSTIGAALRDEKNASIWKDALQRLRRPYKMIPDFIAESHKAIKVSYKFLRLKEAKSLLLLCCLFPEDADIPLESLTYFGMGLGIFEGIKNLEEARDRMCALIQMLKNRSLLLDSDYDEGHVRMHDVVRDVCISIATKKRYIGGNDCKWISCFELVGEKSKLPTGSRFPNLRLLLLSRSNYYSEEEELIELDSAFVDGIRDLSVLCIEYYYSLISLPDTTESLKNLNTLVLDSCSGLKTISVVGKLVNLEILICRNCTSIEELPLEIKGLNRLKLLELTGCRQLQSISRGIISSLVGLEELKMRRSFKKWEAEDREERENAGLRELEALTNLTCLEIDIQNPALATQNMRLSSEKERFHISIGFGFLLSGLCLELKGKASSRDRIEKQLLRDIECLYLRGNGENNVTSVHQPLQELNLRDLATIEQLWKSNCAPLFTNLSSINICDCPYLHNLGTLSVAGKDCLSQLEELCITRCEKLEQVFLWKEGDENIISSNSFHNLKTLSLKDLPALKQLWKSSSQNNYVQPLFTNLSSIEIAGCPGIRNLGQLSIAAGKDCLPHLEKLHIEECEMMEQLFLWNEEDDENTNNSTESPNPHSITKVFPKLEELKLASLPNLATFYQGIPRIEFPLPMILSIEECPKMTMIKSNHNFGGGGSSNADIEDDYLHIFCQPQKGKQEEMEEEGGEEEAKGEITTTKFRSSGDM